MGNFNPSRFFLCNKSNSQSDDFVLVENRDLATLKDLSIRWEKLPKEIVQDDPYNEFINVRSSFTGKVFSIFYLFCLFSFYSVHSFNTIVQL